MTETIDRTDAGDGDHVLDHLVVRFAGDSGDGMQLTGDRFTSVSASFGNDLSTLPDFPAEIRAPAGTVNGVSAFQVNIADHDITTPGDEPNVLVAMNPAALAVNVQDLKPGGILVVNTGNFKETDLKKAKLDNPPLANWSAQKSLDDMDKAGIATAMPGVDHDDRAVLRGGGVQCGDEQGHGPHRRQHREGRGRDLPGRVQRPALHPHKRGRHAFAGARPMRKHVPHADRP